VIFLSTIVFRAVLSLHIAWCYHTTPPKICGAVPSTRSQMHYYLPYR
jgi:hypothetical protein